jgi:prepilin signal peptidase PulO-like enzyme (type II secretory pathway)
MIFYIFSFILGAVIGSFLNVVILRLKIKEPILKDRSHCAFCKKKLAWQELIPILSFFLQKGRCKHCGKKISIQYPLVEFFTGLAFLLIFNFQFSIFNEFLNLQFLISIIFWLLITCFLLIIFVYDLKYYLVPDKIIYPAIIIAFVYCLFGNWKSEIGNLERIFNPILAALIAGLFFLFIVMISKGRWMGLGDVKIGVLMGLLLSLPQVFIALFLAFLSGAIVSIILLILKTKTLKSEIPFGPFLTGATFITLLWGDVLMRCYLNLFI